MSEQARIETAVEVTIDNCELFRAQIAEQAREIERLEAEIEDTLIDWGQIRLELAALKSQQSGVVPEWLTSSRAFADRLYAAGWRDHADAQHAGVAGMYDELLAAAPSAGSQGGDV